MYILGIELWGDNKTGAMVVGVGRLWDDVKSVGFYCS